MNEVRVDFYRANAIVRTEICSNEFEAESLVRDEMELNLYDRALIILVK